MTAHTGVERPSYAPPAAGAHDSIATSPLYNADLAPTSPERRTWSTWNIAALWIAMSVVITTYTLASGLMQQGMFWWQAMLTILLGNTIVLPFAVDADQALAALVDEQVTVVGQTPTFYLQLIRSEKFESADLARLRRCITYGGTMPQAMFDAFADVAKAVADGAGAVIPVLPVAHTIKLVHDGLVITTPDRTPLRAVLTPQGFRCDVLRRAHAQTVRDATDDAGMVEQMGHPVQTVPGNAYAFKITEAIDLVLAEAVFAQQASGQP
jgi:acyl-CoA synthetase (AMP-forming)/AMP-acid ligase II